MELSVCRRYTFEAAHKLDWHAGKCRNLHGHSYVLEVSVVGPLDENGVVLDFEDVDLVVDDVLRGLDHVYLNETIENPTAERVLMHIGERLAALPWAVLRLWETERGSVTLRRS